MARTRTVSYYVERVGQAVRKLEEPTVEMPSRATFYRLFNRLEAGLHTTGSARSRRSLANRPEGVFDQVTVCRPGELMEIDSTTFDVLVRLDNGVVDRVELVGICARLVTDRVRCAGDEEIWLDGALHQPRRRPSFSWAALAA
ncbi:hypothetical protein [Streptomyces sp. LN549]|uniref:hypothetical protein n=1 Tax=Streptomyces sp. LN549 TaxID=3112979 RepID=UPI003722BBED